MISTGALAAASWGQGFTSTFPYTFDPKGTISMWNIILAEVCVCVMFCLGLYFGRAYFTGKLESELSSVKKHNADLTSELSSARKRNSTLEGREAEWQRSFSQLKKRFTTLSNQNGRLTSENGRLTRAAKAHASEVLALKGEIAALEQQLADRAADYRALEDRAAEDYALGHRPHRSSRPKATPRR